MQERKVVQGGTLRGNCAAPLIVEYGMFQFFRTCMQFLLATKLKQELTQVIGLELKPV